MRSIRIGLLWHAVNSGNLGVGALTVANIAIAKSVAADLDLEPKFLVIGMRENGPQYVSCEEAGRYSIDTFSLLSPGGCWSTIGAQDCIVDIGAGDSFSDLYGAKRFVYLWLTKLMAVMSHRPLLLAPQTIGPFTKAIYRWLAGIVLTRAQAVFARDKLSYEAALALAPRASVTLAADVAFALPYVDRGAERGGDVVRVELNVSGLLFDEASSGRNRFGLGLDYADLTRRILAELTRRPGIEVHLLVHVASSNADEDNDEPVADALAKEFPSAVRAPNFSTPGEAKSYISSLDFLVAARMHACIAAYSSGTPVVPIAYSRKFSGVFGLLDYDWIVPTQGWSTDQALAHVLDCLQRRGELAADIGSGMLRVDALLGAYRARLRTFFLEAVGGQ